MVRRCFGSGRSLPAPISPQVGGGSPAQPPTGVWTARATRPLAGRPARGLRAARLPAVLPGAGLPAWPGFFFRAGREGRGRRVPGTSGQGRAVCPEGAGLAALPVFLSARCWGCRPRGSCGPRLSRSCGGPSRGPAWLLAPGSRAGSPGRSCPPGTLWGLPLPAAPQC